MKLSIIIPCYNEKATIREVVDAVLAAPYDDKEIIIVDDCSKDGTKEVLLEEIEPLVHQILFHKVNQGKGAALRTGIQAATGDIVLIQDIVSKEIKQTDENINLRNYVSTFTELENLQSGTKIIYETKSIVKLDNVSIQTPIGF